MWPLTRQIDGHPASQRVAVEQNALGRDMLLRDEPFISRLGGCVTACFARPAFASAVTRVIEDQYRCIQMRLPVCDRWSAAAQIAGVSVAIEHGSILGRPSGRGTPPRANPVAVGAPKRNLLHPRIRGRIPFFA